MRIWRKETHEHHSLGEGRLALFGLLIVQAFIGYEWLMSGLAKIVRGGFPSGMGDQLREKSEGISGWYKSFLDGTILPNAHVFAYLIIVGEVLIGATFIVAAALWLWRWERLSFLARMTVLGSTALAALGGVFMNINFHLANGSAHPWLIPKDGFDEGVDLDSLLPLLQIVLLVIATRLLLTLWRTAHPAESARSTKSNHDTEEPMTRPVINITPTERGGRVFMGLLGVVGGAILLAGAGGTLAVVLALLLVLAGLDLMVTGALGHCPLYRKLGHTPASLRRTA